MGICKVALLLLIGISLSKYGYGTLSYPGDGCSDYEIHHTVSATLDTDIGKLKERIGDPSKDPESLCFYLFGQNFWKLASLDGQKHKVFFTSGGSATLGICGFEEQYGVLIELLDTQEYDFQDDLRGVKIIIKFLPESWYGNRVVLSVGFTLGTHHLDEEHATNVVWSYLYSFIHHAQAMFGAYPCDCEFSTSSGYCNNVGRHVWGSINQPMRRLQYKDPDPRWLPEKDGAPVEKSRPSARRVSNELLHQTENEQTASGVNMLWVTFGQFVDHDITITATHGPNHPIQKSYNIPVASDDKYFFKSANDANCKHEADFVGNGDAETEEDAAVEEDASVEEAKKCDYSYISFSRSQICSFKGEPLEPPIQCNGQTAFLDLSQLYGNSGAKINFLRAFKGGLLKTGEGNTLPYNGKDGVGLQVAIEAENDQTHGVAGDLRANEQPYLTGLHIIWLREHNLIAKELGDLFPEWGDEKLFQEARKIAIAEYQGIVYNEWLPFLIGIGALGPYNGYKQCVNPSISVFFSTCAFRFGHSMVTEVLKACDNHLKDIFEKPLEKTLFQTEVWEDPNVNVDSLILGGYKLIAEECDGGIQNGLRNHLFSDVHNGTAGGFDLAAASIQRCRDHACPSWSDARKNFKLKTPKRWEQLKRFLATPGDAEKVLNTYGKRNLRNLDPFPLGLLEKREDGALVGPLFQRAIADQFWRLREGDRFHYEAIDFNCDIRDKYPRIKDVIRGRVTHKEIFLRNLDEADDSSVVKKLDETLNANIFLSPQHTQCDPPLLILQATLDDEKGPKCPRSSRLTRRYFWDNTLRSPVLFKICDVDDELVNGLKGFESAIEARTSCGGGKGPVTCSSQGQVY